MSARAINSLPILLAVIAVSGGAQARPTVSDTVLVSRGEMDSNSADQVVRLQRPMVGGAVGVQIILEIARPRDVDLDLYVFAAHPDSVSDATPLCSSEDVGGVESCRILSRGPVAVAFAVIESTGGRGKSSYAIKTALVSGPRLAGTDLIAADARPLTVSQPVSDTLRTFSFEGPARNLYVVSQPGGDSIFASLSSPDGRPLRVTVFGANGDSRDRIDSGDSFFQRRFNWGDQAKLYFLVQPANENERAPRLAYSFGVDSRPTSPRIRASDRPMSWSGAGSRNFELDIPFGWSGVLTLEGRGKSFVVQPRGQTSAVALVTRAGTASRAYIGEPVEKSALVLRGVTKPTTYDVRVIDSGVERYSLPWEFTMRGTRLDGPRLIALPPDPALWADPWLRARRERSEATGARGAKVFLIPAPPEELRAVTVKSKGGSGTRYEITFGGRVDPGLNIAVTDEIGNVVDISDRGVSWLWPAERSSMHVVVFPDPSADGSRTGGSRQFVLCFKAEPPLEAPRSADARPTQARMPVARPADPRTGRQRGAAAAVRPDTSGVSQSSCGR